MTTIRPNLAIVTLVLEIAWLVVAVSAYESEVSDAVHSAVVSLAAIAIIWASPAIALCVVAWLVEQAMRARELAPPRPPAVASAPPPPPSAAE